MTRLPPPPEILDQVVDHLHDETDALKACCLVSKSWVPRARVHLFARIDFGWSSIGSWMKTFPNPSNSPAYHARNIQFRGRELVYATQMNTRPWVRSFDRVDRLELVADADSLVGVTVTTGIPLVQFYGLSPSLKSLWISGILFSLSHTLNLICSFPLLENLTTGVGFTENDIDQWISPPTSPKLTGSLKLWSRVRPVGYGLLGFRGGLNFTRIEIECEVEDAEVIVELVSMCSYTLESLFISYYLPETPVTRTPIDLSKATKLRDVEFEVVNPSVRWITTTLQTAKLESLRHVTLLSYLQFKSIEEGFREEWQDLDHLLVQLWTSHSVVPRIKYPGLTGSSLDQYVASFLPELAKRSVVMPWVCSRENGDVADAIASSS